MFLYYGHFICLTLIKLTPCLLSVAGGEHGEHGSSGDHNGGHSEGTHLPNVIGIIFGHESALYDWVNVIFAFTIAIFFTISTSIVYRRRQLIPGPFQNFMEMLVEGMYNFIYSILGKDAKKYIPFLGTLFFLSLIHI